MAGRAFVSRFSPNRTDPALLEAIFVQRHQLADTWLKRLRDSIRTKSKHHLLAVGPRGCGKSHLAALLVGRLRKDPALLKRVRIAWLPEDETTPSFWKFLLRILRALTAEYGDDFPPPPNERLAGISDENRALFLTEYLLEKLDGKTLLVVVENLDDVMRGLKTEGQKRWRAFLQQHPVAATLATAQQLTDDLSDREKPFFNFFQIEHLKALTAEDALLLLRKIAEQTGKPLLAEFLNTPTGRARVKAIRHIAGGSHRIFIILSEFATRESLDDLVMTFEELLDELTPYYQERLRWLPDQQREIVEFLCRQTHTVKVKEIATDLFLTEQTAAAQLKSLRDKGYVTSKSVGRESRYELAEPLMRLCVEVKDPQREPIRLIVEFLRIWYNRSQLESRLQCLPIEAERERRHFHAAILAQRPGVPSPIEEVLDQELDAARKTGNAEAEVQVLVEIAATAESAERVLAAGQKLFTLECYNDAFIVCERAVELSPKNGKVWALKGNVLMMGLDRYSDAVVAFERATILDHKTASNWSDKGFALYMANQLDDSLASYETALDIDPNDSRCWAFKGGVLEKLGRHAEAVVAYDQAVQLAPNSPHVWNAVALHLKSVSRYEEALATLSRALERFPGNVDLWISKSDILTRIQRHEDALAACDEAIAIAPTSLQAICCRARVLVDLDRKSDALAEAERARSLGPRTADEWESVGLVFGYTARGECALAAFKRATELEPKNSFAWFMMGVCLNNLGTFSEAIDAYSRSIDLRPNISLSWKCRAESRLECGQFDVAIEDLLHAIELNPSDADVLDNIVMAYALSGQWLKMEESLAARFRHSSRLDVEADLSGVIATLFRASTDTKTWEMRVSRLATIAGEAQAARRESETQANEGLLSPSPTSTSSPLAALGDGLVRSLTDGAYYDAAAKHLEAWAEVWRTVAKDQPDLSFAVRLFCVGIQYLQSKDKRVLLDLVQEERSVLRDLFNLDDDSEG